MPNAAYDQTSFLGGEWSPSYQGRADNPRYKTALNVCLNGLPIEEGAWVRRSGTKFVNTTRGGQAARLMPFNYSDVLPYTLEFTDGYLRIMNGDDFVLEQAVTITNISTANPAVMTIDTARAWATGDEIRVVLTTRGLAPALAGLIPRSLIVTRLTSTTFSLSDPVDGTGVDGSVDGNVWDGTSAASACRVVGFVTPYTAPGSWYDNRGAQVNQRLVIFNKNYPPQQLYITSVNATDGRFSTFAFGPAVFVDGPYFPPVDGQTVGVSALTGSITATFTGGFGPNQTDVTTADVGRLIRLHSEPPLYDDAHAYAYKDVVKYQDSYWIALKSTTGNPPASTVGNWCIADNIIAPWVWGIITAKLSTTTATVALQSDLAFSNTVVEWKLGMFGGTDLWPVAGCGVEGRLWMCRGPNVMASRPGDPFVMRPTLEDGTVTDDCGINYTLEGGTKDADDLLWMSGDQSGIICGSFAGEWLIQASVLSDPLTPSSTQAKRISKFGAGSPEPVRTGISLLFVQKYRRRIMEMFADVFTGKYRAPDLSVAARHLTVAQVEELAYQEEPVPVVWLRNRDGSWAGVTYRRVSAMEEPVFVGWHRHTLGSGRGVASIVMSGVPVPVEN